MEIDRSLALLGGLTPAQFMRRHWQKKPLLVRQAWPGVAPPLDREALFALAGEDGVESRLLIHADGRWRLRQGPLLRSQIPSLRRRQWTLLLHGLDLHCQAAHEMLARFRFVPDARLDDLMLSFATDGGGVGPHADSYDVFLLQVQGRRRWRIGRISDHSSVAGLPVRILARFEPSDEWLLEPGDMLYLPPLWGHEGLADGEAMTCSVGFRASSSTALAQALLHQIADDLAESPDGAGELLYRDAGQPPTPTPARLPAGLREFAVAALRRALRDPRALDRALGEWVTEPKPRVWFDGGQRLRDGRGVHLDRRTRMAYDERHVFINGEAHVAVGGDARLVRRLADARCLGAADVARLGAEARTLLGDWCRSGWAHAEPARQRPGTTTG